MKSILVTTLVLTLAVAANGVVLVQEDFSTNGVLVGTTPDVGAAWVAHSGAGLVPVQVANGQAVVAQGSGSREDVSVPFANGEVAGAGEKFYAAFDMSVTGGNTAHYFAHFKDSATYFSGRVWVLPGKNGGDYTMGVTETGTAPTEAWSTDLSYGTTYRVVVGYDFDAKTSKMWINPVNESSPSLSSTQTYTTAVQAFALRQAGGSSTEQVDNLIVGTSFAEVVPEPASLVLLLVGGLFLSRRR